MTPSLSDLPQLSSGTRVLIAGASSGIGLEMLRLLTQQSRVCIGAHCFQHGHDLEEVIEGYASGLAKVKSFRADLSTADASRSLVQSFVDWAGGIDLLVQLTGGIRSVVPWDELTEADWDHDLSVNLKGPFFLAQAAMRHMSSSGGKVILTGTASARHGGGSNSVAYGISKAGIEFMAKGLARVGAPNGILVNAVCPGFIDTSFHTERMHRTDEQLKKRAELALLKRAGKPREVAGAIMFLASTWGDYITGECIVVSGGDWL